MGPLFLFVGKTKEPFISEGIEKYAALIRHFMPLEIREIKGASGRDPKAAVEKEADIVLSRLSGSDYVVALDERGDKTTSAGFAGRLDSIMQTGRRPVFVVGGPFGLSGRVRQRADAVMALSSLTFTHEMARLILAEQVYRALTILKGRTYHY